ncbi:major facilitator family transporter [Pseudomonas saudimassiliensis]|uniref:Major facilitator family transporter n=1 Tax=Pseudomonas saudimassiliensis TaxID=1461581 RepID=A0A078MCI4_9PSED|nr:MFS transporter [Pseudomonas saudimassiliensis]CEA02436.1 major facilitator family transporter [Pseudomonas saudimassiliensis]CEF25837.1 major facilitator family transporter [Pseudomonas saudimassiliensis]
MHSPVASPALKSSNTLPMAACMLALFTTILTSHMPTPLYAAWQQAWGFSATALTAVFSIYVLGVVITLLTMGSLSDQLGRRQMLIPGLLFIMVGSVIFMLAADIYHLAAARLLTGIGTGLVTGAATAAVVELEPNGNWTRGATLSALAFTLGAATGPTVSSMTLRWTDHGTVWSFLVAIALCLITLVMLARAPWPAHLGQRQQDFRWRAWRPTPVRVPRALLGTFTFAAAAISLAWSTGSLYSALGPTLARELIGVSDLALAGLFAAAWQLVAGLSQFAAQRQPLNRLLMAGPVLLILGLIALGGAVWQASVWLFIGATVMTGIAAGTIGVIATVTIARSAPPSERGAMNSAFFLVAYLTMATIVLSIGFASDQIGLVNSTLGFVALICCAALGIMFMRRRVQP